MSQLIIKNIGPIKAIDLQLKRINVFIGPQSSGKSTIAKVISFCQWLEKDCVKRQRINHVDDDFVQESFVDYHNIEDYISEESYFCYTSKVLRIEFTKGKLKIKRGEEFKTAKVSKNAYIPSERNLICVPGIFSTKMPGNYILSFLSDWLLIREKYTSNNTTEVSPTGDFYYFNEKDETDMLKLENGKSIRLSEASSGMQSVTPLVVYINYITDWIYSHPEMQSAEEMKGVWEAALANVLDYSSSNEPTGILDIINGPEAPDRLKESFKRLLTSLQNTGDLSSINDESIQRVEELRDIFSRPSFSNLVIEEPEQNLFPQTQRLLVEHILSNLHGNRDTLVMTTHSPFVLYALNNCLLAYLASKADGEEIDWMTAIPVESFVDPADVNVWELRDGHVENFQGERNRTIQDSRGLIRDNYFDRVMKGVMGDFHSLLGMI